MLKSKFLVVACKKKKMICNEETDCKADQGIKREFRYEIS